MVYDMRSIGRLAGIGSLSTCWPVALGASTLSNTPVLIFSFFLFVRGKGGLGLMRLVTFDVIQTITVETSIPPMLPPSRVSGTAWLSAVWTSVIGPPLKEC